MANRWSAEFEQDVREYYISHRISLRELARNSEQLFGHKFIYEDVKFYYDQGKWDFLKNITEGEGSVYDEVNVIRKVLFRQIVAMSEGGLIVQGDSDELATLLTELASRGFEVEQVAPGGIESTLVNSYMNLLSKGNFDLGKVASRKTSQQKALELLREAHGD